jgi:hypothetical protein
MDIDCDIVVLEDVRKHNILLFTRKKTKSLLKIEEKGVG